MSNKDLSESIFKVIDNIKQDKADLLEQNKYLLQENESLKLENEELKLKFAENINLINESIAELKKIKEDYGKFKNQNTQ